MPRSVLSLPAHVLWQKFANYWQWAFLQQPSLQLLAAEHISMALAKPTGCELPQDVLLGLCETVNNELVAVPVYCAQKAVRTRLMLSALYLYSMAAMPPKNEACLEVCPVELDGRLADCPCHFGSPEALRHLPVFR